MKNGEWRSLVSKASALYLATALSAALAGQAPATPAAKEGTAAWPKVWAEHAGNEVSLEGIPANAKLGALLLGEEDQVWIDGLDEWPPEVFEADGKGKRLRVTGTVALREDLPAYVQKPGEPPKTGIPVQSESQLKAARTRVVLAQARWSVVK